MAKPDTIEVPEDRHAGLPDGWTPSLWTKRLRTLADACNELNPDKAAVYRVEADRIGSQNMI